MYTCTEGWLRVMYAAANGLTFEAVAARTDTLHLTLEQVRRTSSGSWLVWLVSLASWCVWC